MGCEKLSRVLGYQPSREELCGLALLGLGVVKPILEAVGAGSAKPLEALFDPEAPRLIVKASSSSYEATIDVAPDGTEVTMVIRLGKGLDEEGVEEAASEAIEGWSEASGLEEYDVDYSPEDGCLVVLLKARLPEDIPTLDILVERIKHGLGMGSANASERPSRGDEALDHRPTS